MSREVQESQAEPQEGLPKYVEYSEVLHEIEIPETAINELSKELDIEPMKAAIFAEYLDHFKIRSEDLQNKNVIDVGSGTGSFKEAALKVVESRITNFDDEEIYQNADIRGRIEKLPFENDSFDLVLAHKSVPLAQIADEKEYFAKVPQAISEMVRVAKKGGVIKIFPVGISDPGTPDKKQILLEMRKAVLHSLEAIHEQSPSLRMHVTRNVLPNDHESWWELLEMKKD